MDPGRQPVLPPEELSWYRLPHPRTPTSGPEPGTRAHVVPEHLLRGRFPHVSVLLAAQNFPGLLGLSTRRRLGAGGRNIHGLGVGERVRRGPGRKGSSPRGAPVWGVGWSRSGALGGNASTVPRAELGQGSRGAPHPCPRRCCSACGGWPAGVPVPLSPEPLMAPRAPPGPCFLHIRPQPALFVGLVGVEGSKSMEEGPRACAAGARGTRAEDPAAQERPCLGGVLVRPSLLSGTYGHRHHGGA